MSATVSAEKTGGDESALLEEREQQGLSLLDESDDKNAAFPAGGAQNDNGDTRVLVTGASG
jgi:hypothetical protein